MSQRIKNLYTHLIQNRQHELLGWYEDYKEFSGDVEKIRNNLASTGLREQATYNGTSFEGSTNPFDRFIERLIYTKSNGIASRGQSVLSSDNLNMFKSTNGFDDIITKIIDTPNFDTYNKFKEWWIARKVGYHRVLINRAIAACTTKVSTTVDEGKFNQIFYWLQKEELIDKYQSTEQDWFNKNTFVVDQLDKQLKDVDGFDEYWRGIFVWELYENIANPFSLKKQVVKYGSPGTGKTFTARREAQLLFNIWKAEFDSSNKLEFNNYIETIQFHPSYTYEDFMEGLRPKLKNGLVQLVLQNGIFKDFCIKAGKWERDIANLPKEIIKKSWSELTIKDITEIKSELTGGHWNYIFDIKGTSKKLADAVPPFFFIIDEINRAELSRVFGELMYCLEYRGIGGAIKTQYTNLNNNDTGMIKIAGSYQFFIPNNVYIIGTMNTIDRSVESFDFALRRRFKWEEIMPDSTLLYYHLKKINKDKWVKLAENLENLNAKIEKEPLLGRDFQIGHAYLWNLQYSKNLDISDVRKAVWDDSIAPLLQEYLRGTGKEDLIVKLAESFGLKQ